MSVWLSQVLSFYVEQDFQLNLHIGHIACNDICLPHVLPFCVQHCQSQIWIEGCIDCMGIWLLHILPFSVEQNVPFNSLDDCIARKGIWLFHVQIFCWVRFPFEMTWRLHCMQGNWTYSFSDLLCWTRFLFVVLRKIRIHEVIQSLQYIIIKILAGRSVSWHKPRANIVSRA